MRDTYLSAARRSTLANSACCDTDSVVVRIRSVSELTTDSRASTGERGSNELGTAADSSFSSAN